MTHTSHDLASPTGLFQRNSFYVESLSKEGDYKRVFDQSKAKNQSQFVIAEEIADAIALDPPPSDSKPNLSRYMRDKVLAEIPNKLRFDDTFWSCLLYLLDSKNVPLCSLGGPFHKMVYRVYDDFDPSDVT